MKSLSIQLGAGMIMAAILIGVGIPFLKAEAAQNPGGLMVVCTGEPLVKPTNWKPGDSVPAGVEQECTLIDLVNLIQTVINFLIMISLPLATVAFMYVGAILMTAQGDVSKITRAKQIAQYVLYGFLFVLSAWLIIYTITSILKPEYNQFISK